MTGVNTSQCHFRRIAFISSSEVLFHDRPTISWTSELHTRHVRASDVRRSRQLLSRVSACSNIPLYCCLAITRSFWFTPKRS
jgi:hypothetical protein